MADKLFRTYYNEKVEATTLPSSSKVLIQEGADEPKKIDADLIGGGQLISVTESGNTGFRLKSEDPANHGNIGSNAVDLSIQTQYSSADGATGNNSYAEGFNTTASGNISHSEGDRTIASGGTSHAQGTRTTASGNSSHAEGVVTTASGNSSHAEGDSNFARSLGEHSGGVFGTDYTPQSASGFYLIDRLVNYGNGADASNRSDAYTLFKNGMQKFFTAALSTITNAVKGSVMLDENAAMHIHNGSAFKKVAFISEVATAAQGVLADNSVQKSGAGQTVSANTSFTGVLDIANNSTGNNGFRKTLSFPSGGYARNVIQGVNTSSLDDPFNIGIFGNGTVYSYAYIGFNLSHTSTNNMTISPTGNIGLGITVATEKIEVVGNIKANSFLSPLITIVGDITLTVSNSEVIIDAASQAVSVILPTLASVPVGKKYTVIAYDATNTITIATSSSQQIRQVKTDNATSLTLGSGDIYTVINTGTYWQIISKQ